VTDGRPELQLGVPVRPHLEERILVPIMKLYTRQRLRVAAVEAFGQPENRGQCADHASALAGQLGIVLMVPFRCGPSMVARDECQRVNLVGLETP